MLLTIGDRNVRAVEVQQVGVFLTRLGVVQDGIEETQLAKIIILKE